MVSNESSSSTNRETANATRTLNKAAANLSECAAGINEAVQGILRWSDTPGTKATEHRKILLAKLDALKNLSGLCSKGAQRLSDVVARLVRQAPHQEALAELLTLSRFISDQLRSEKHDLRHTLSVLQGAAHETSKHNATN